MQLKMNNLHKPTHHKERCHIYGNLAFVLHVFLFFSVLLNGREKEHLGLLSFVLNESSYTFRD